MIHNESVDNIAEVSVVSPSQLMFWITVSHLPTGAPVAEYVVRLEKIKARECMICCEGIYINNPRQHRKSGIFNSASRVAAELLMSICPSSVVRRRKFFT